MNLSRIEDTLTFEPERLGSFKIYNEEDRMIIQGDAPVRFLDDGGKHHVYRIVWDDQTSYIAETYMPNTKITNFRDIGGFYTSDQRQVKYNCFYRSAPIVVQDEEALRYIDTLGMKTILDFRSDHEVSLAPDHELSGCTYICKGAIVGNDLQFAGNFDFKELINSNKLDELKKYMMMTYENLPFHNEAYQIMFDRMLADDVPLVFHCSAGKDRTGFGAYLILKTLGVDDATIMEDYLASNMYRKEENDKIVAKAGKLGEAIVSLMNVYPEYLQSSIDKIAEKYPSFEDYLLKEYGIDDTLIQVLQNKYLY